VLLHFTRARLRVATRPRRLVAGRRSRLRVKVTFARGGPARGAKVHVRGRVRRTNAAGVARFTVRPRHRGRLRVRATRPGAIAGSRRVRVVID